MDEFDFIARLLAPLAESKAALGLKDDAAVLDVPDGQQLVVTKDAMSQGVHFIGDEPAGLIAQKLLRVNLSDLAAMGAEPYGYFLALMLPRETHAAWLADFARGLKSDQDRYGLTLLGGDTTSVNGPLGLCMTALGLVPQAGALLRSGARPGDAVYVSGTLGDAALGLKVARGELPADDYLSQRYRLPEPRLALGRALRGIASACMDISDGLAQDMEHLCRASGVAARIDVAAILLSPAASMKLPGMDNDWEPILAGGDDYELLFTASPAANARVFEAATLAATQVTRIGVIEAGQEVRFLNARGTAIPLRTKGYRHF